MLILISIFHLGAKPGIRVVSRKYKSSRAKKKKACNTMLLEMQSKHISLTICPKQKQCIVCAQHIMAQSAGGSILFIYFFFLFFFEKRVIISSLSLRTQKNHCPISLFSDSIIQMSSALQSEPCLLTKAAV